MKRKLSLVLWTIGSTGAVLWTCFWTFALIYTKKHPLVAFELIGFGILLAWEGFKTVMEVKNSK